MMEVSVEEAGEAYGSQETRSCRGPGCTMLFKPTSRRNIYCSPECYTNSSKQKKASKRDGDPISPQSTRCTKKDKKEDQSRKPTTTNTDHKSLNEQDLLLMGSDVLVPIIMELRAALKEAELVATECCKEVECIQKELKVAKLAFADKIIKSYQNPVSYAAVTRRADQRPEEGKAVLVASVDTARTGSPISLTRLDTLLRSREHGPVAQSLHQKDGRVVMTFNDTKTREAAKGILESSEECKEIFTSVANPKGYYPVVAKYMDLRPTDEEIMDDIRHRNPILKEHLKSIKVVYRCKVGNEGHVSLWITSMNARNLILDRGEIFASGRRCRVDEPDLHREVKRCFKCQQYGHLVRDCRATADVCGKCTGEHRTSSCTVKDPKFFKCSNCKRKPEHIKSYSDGKHQAGDRLCPYQLKAIGRYKRNTGL